VRRFVSERFGLTHSRSSCHNYLHRLRFVLKRPTKRLLKADEAQREAFVADYAALRREAQTTGAKHFFVDEARQDGYEYGGEQSLPVNGQVHSPLPWASATSAGQTSLRPSFIWAVP
jgi:hypothetical protein